ncbi:MAG: HAD family hydrolase [Ruminococcaceae bacterium]|nr:HAD family hydrolase [Oscillospiraceae bacterium]
MKYTHLLFDLDGMLINTLEGVVKSAQYALRQYGMEYTLEELRPFLGPPLRDSFIRFGLNETEASEAIFKFRERYNLKGAKESHLFPEIPDLLKKLKNAGYRLGVATSKYEEYAKTFLRDFGIFDMFEYITGSNLDESISKKHEVIEESLKRFDITDKRHFALMIGDMKYDDIGARNAGIDSLGVYTGTASPNEHEEAGATYIAYSFEDLEKILLVDLY